MPRMALTRDMMRSADEWARFHADATPEERQKYEQAKCLRWLSRRCRKEARRFLIEEVQVRQELARMVSERRARGG